jgi:hypothetical protein
MKPFNLEEALAGKPVVTRLGKKVTGIYHFDKAKTIFRVIAQIEGEFGLQSYSPDGRWKDSQEDHELDIFMYCPERWVNIYYSKAQDSVWSSIYYQSEEEAKENIIISSIHIATLKIEL